MVITFNDSETWELSGKANLSEIMIVCNHGKLNAIQMKYGDQWTNIRGYPWSDQAKEYFPLDNDEFVNATVTESDLVFLVRDIMVVTNKRTIGPCGPFPQAGRRLLDHRGSRLMFLAGYAGGSIDTLVFHWA